MQRDGHTSTGGALWSPLLPLHSQVALQGWGGELERGRQKPKGGGAAPPTPGEPAAPEHGSQTPQALPKPLEARCGCPNASHAGCGSGSTHVECVPRPLRTTRGEACPQAKGVPAGGWVPQGVWPLRGLPFSKPGPGGVGGNAQCRPVPGAGGPGTCFLPNRGPQVSALGGQIQDPESGSRIGSGPALGVAQRPGGLRRRLLSFGGGRAGGLPRLLRPLGWITAAASYVWDTSKKSSLR